MYHQSDQTITEAISPCRRCGIALIGECNFCRYCGTPQINDKTADLHKKIVDSHDAVPQDGVRSVVNTFPIENPEELSRGGYDTKRLTVQKLYHPVSGPLVNAVVAGVPATPSNSSLGSLPRRMLLALMAVPIWVMIILLSPIDAYASAKIIGNRI